MTKGQTTYTVVVFSREDENTVPINTVKNVLRIGVLDGHLTLETASEEFKFEGWFRIACSRE